MDAVKRTTVEVGRIRCTLLEMVPGVPGTSLQVEAALADIDPGAVAADVDLHDALVFRRHQGRHHHAPLPFAADQVRRVLDRWDEDIEVQNPYQAAAEHAHRENVPFIPLSPEAGRAGFFLRRRIAAAFRDANPTPRDDQDPPTPWEVAEKWPQVARKDPAFAALMKKEEDEILRRFRDLVGREQQVRVTAVLRPPHASYISGRLEHEALPRPMRSSAVAVETATLEPSEAGRGLR